MRYLVTARLRVGKAHELAEAIDNGSLGRDSVAYGEYERNMRDARIDDDGRVRWVEVCYCPTPLQEEREFWEPFLALEKVQDAHARTRCRDVNGEEPWACSTCDCTARLEKRLESRGTPFLKTLSGRKTGG